MADYLDLPIVNAFPTNRNGRNSFFAQQPMRSATITSTTKTGTSSATNCKSNETIQLYNAAFHSRPLHYKKRTKRCKTMSTITADYYKEHMWPQICFFIQQLLLESPNHDLSTVKLKENKHAFSNTKSSEQEVAVMIYNICLQKKFITTLYADVTTVIRTILAEKASNFPFIQNKFMFASALTTFLKKFQKAINIISCTFKFLDKIIVEEIQEPPLRHALKATFDRVVMSEGFKQRIMELFEILSHPKTDPLLLLDLVRALYNLDSSYQQLNVQIFAKFIPGLLRAKSLQEEAHITSIQVQKWSAFFEQCPVDWKQRGIKRKYDA